MTRTEEFEQLRPLLFATAHRMPEVIAAIADTGDPGSLGLHCRHGFQHAGRLIKVGCKHASRVDTVLLQRSLTPAR